MGDIRQRHIRGVPCPRNMPDFSHFGILLFVLQYLGLEVEQNECYHVSSKPGLIPRCPLVDGTLRILAAAVRQGPNNKDATTHELTSRSTLRDSSLAQT
jgi:hypothetical protein